MPLLESTPLDNVNARRPRLRSWPLKDQMKQREACHLARAVHGECVTCGARALVMYGTRRATSINIVRFPEALGLISGLPVI
jgi:hypothetical protein